jgi:hypothetical protein
MLQGGATSDEPASRRKNIAALFSLFSEDPRIGGSVVLVCFPLRRLFSRIAESDRRAASRRGRRRHRRQPWARSTWRPLTLATEDEGVAGLRKALYGAEAPAGVIRVTELPFDMKYLFCLLLLAFQQANALTITSINVSTVMGYPDFYSPTPYPDYNRFSILGAAYSYKLSDGEVRGSGAGWIPYTNGQLTSVHINGNQVDYAYANVSNWAKGNGTVFYSMGQVWCPSCADNGTGLWTEGQLAPVSPIVLTATLGSTVATLSGVAKVVSNNSGSRWGTAENFVPYASPEGSLVNYSATYTLLNGATWQADTFDHAFSYSMAGAINVSPVPEPSAALLFPIGLGAVLVAVRRRRMAA